jgi:hypothetical protein
MLSIPQWWALPFSERTPSHPWPLVFRAAPAAETLTTLAVIVSEGRVDVLDHLQAHAAPLLPDLRAPLPGGQARTLLQVALTVSLCWPLTRWLLQHDACPPPEASATVRELLDAIIREPQVARTSGTWAALLATPSSDLGPLWPAHAPRAITFLQQMVSQWNNASDEHRRELRPMMHELVAARVQRQAPPGGEQEAAYRAMEEGLEDVLDGIVQARLADPRKLIEDRLEEARSFAAAGLVPEDLLAPYWPADVTQRALAEGEPDCMPRTLARQAREAILAQTVAVPPAPGRPRLRAFRG